MGVKKFKPVTPSSRFRTVHDSAEITATVAPRRAAVRKVVFFIMVMLLKATGAGSVPGDRRATARP